jgi:hypothetical protein
VNAANPGGEVGTEPAIGGRIGQTAYRAEAKIDSTGASWRASRWFR